ncbi:MAG TPA: YidC/Oxa1 family membrane protein insertase [Candidatus Elarobacter sp.]|nr:YidC/Oxa1 family membrane protein insertase [Candidatus Elarobacter sp.]
MTPLLAANFLDPLVRVLAQVLTGLHHVIPSYGWDMIVLALVLRIILWPLSAVQFRSMAGMQKLAPAVKQLQAIYKGDPQVLNQKMMALYKEHKVNPLAGCVPLLVQFPVLIGLFWAIQSQIKEFGAEHWLWIGSGASVAAQGLKIFGTPIFATSLAAPDLFLLVLYVVSMYFTVRYGSPPSTDPQQAQTQKMMAILSPAMIAYFGFQYRWASALYIYWLASNVFTVAQQYYMFRRYGLVGPKAKETAAAAAAIAAQQRSGGDADRVAQPGAKPAKNGTAASNGKRAYRPKKRARR